MSIEVGIWEAIIIVLIFLIGYKWDGSIRKKMYMNDMDLMREKTLSTTGEMEKTMISGFEIMLKMGMLKHGLVGTFDFNDLKPADVYKFSGQPTFIGVGVVLDKRYVTSDEVINDMANYVRKESKSFIADSVEIRNRYIVMIYSQDNLRQFIWDDEELYNNVKAGDSVGLSYNEKEVLSVGYKTRGNKDG
ncbi:MAG: hypothetical protein ACW96U_00950 [Candidatus Heimdallarchaeaceae archaeon]|jgi:hypothetical protein